MCARAVDVSASPGPKKHRTPWWPHMASSIECACACVHGHKGGERSKQRRTGGRESGRGQRRRVHSSPRRRRRRCVRRLREARRALQNGVVVAQRSVMPLFFPAAEPKQKGWSYARAVVWGSAGAGTRKKGRERRGEWGCVWGRATCGDMAALAQAAVWGRDEFKGQEK